MARLRDAILVLFGAVMAAGGAFVSRDGLIKFATAIVLPAASVFVIALLALCARDDARSNTARWRMAKEERLMQRNTQPVLHIMTETPKKSRPEDEVEEPDSTSN